MRARAGQTRRARVRDDLGGGPNTWSMKAPYGSLSRIRLDVESSSNLMLRMTGPSTGSTAARLKWWLPRKWLQYTDGTELHGTRRPRGGTGGDLRQVVIRNRRAEYSQSRQSSHYKMRIARENGSNLRIMLVATLTGRGSGEVAVASTLLPSQLEHLSIRPRLHIVTYLNVPNKAAPAS